MADKDKTSEQPRGNSGVDEIVSGVSDVVGAALGVGAAVAKTLAQVTAGGKQVPEPEGESGAVNAMVHYGVAAITNVVGAVVANVAGSQVDQPVESGNESGNVAGVSRPQTSSAIPLVERGGSLRIPLSIENSGAEPMQGMVFQCIGMDGEASGPGKPLGSSALRFEPEILDVAPRDFEKLTVYIDTAADTAPGTYDAIIGLGAGAFESHISFNVVAEDN